MGERKGEVDKRDRKGTGKECEREAKGMGYVEKGEGGDMERREREGVWSERRGRGYGRKGGYGGEKKRIRLQHFNIRMLKMMNSENR